MAPFQSIIYNKTGCVAFIYLDRLHVRNAYNVAMRDGLYQAMEAVNEDPDVKVAVLGGSGPDFCAGADLTEFGTAPSMVVARSVRWERDLWGLFLRTRKPLLAAIHGHCLGSGIEMALLCDLRIAAEDAIFGMPEVSLGLIPAAGGTQTLPRFLGLSQSLQLLLTAQRIDAHCALALGLVTQVVEGHRLEEEVKQIAQKLTSFDQEAVRAVKEALWHGPDIPMSQALELETRLALKLISARAR